jgi:hypothetical protein
MSSSRPTAIPKPWPTCWPTPARERVVNKARIREMKHAAGVRYLDFTPVMIVALASVVGARYLAIGTGDTELYIFAGMLAAVVISVRVFLFKGAGKAN